MKLPTGQGKPLPHPEASPLPLPVTALLLHLRAGSIFNFVPPLETPGGNSLVVQWLGLCVFTAEGADSVPGRRTKIPQATGFGVPHTPRKKATPGDL